MRKVKISAPTKVIWNEIKKVGMPPKELRKIGDNGSDRTFLCRGNYSIFVSHVFSDGSGFALEEDDVTQAWAVIDGF